VKQQTELWLRRAAADLDVAQMSFERGHFELCLFHCQQTLEKLLKAILIERSATNMARRTHDLVLLAELLNIRLPEESFLFLRQLAELYVPSRYGDETVDFEYAPPNEWLKQTEDLFSWLRQQLS
jgi:HEPN domain-containing protein